MACLLLKRRVKFMNKAFTAIEMIVAVTVFSLLFIGVFQLQNTALTGFNVGLWKADAQRMLVKGFKLMRDEMEKATYPSKIFGNGTMLFGTSAPTDFAVKDPTNSANLTEPNDDGGIAGIHNFYMKYKGGITDAPGQGASIDLIRFYICTPIYAENDVIMKKSEIATFNNLTGSQTEVIIKWRGPTNDFEYPAIQYQVGAAGTPKDIIQYVKTVEITSGDVMPPGAIGKQFSVYDVHAVLNLKVTLSSATDSRVRKSGGGGTEIVVIDEMKARSHVHAVNSL